MSKRIYKIAITGGRDVRWWCPACRAVKPNSYEPESNLGKCSSCGQAYDVGADELIFPALDRVKVKAEKMNAVLIIISGKCPSGVDALCEAWARSRDVALIGHPADWDAHGRAAGPIRNKKMAQGGLSGLVAFPGGRGTANMVKECKLAGVPIWFPATNTRWTPDEWSQSRKPV